MINYQNTSNSQTNTICTPCQQNAMRNMTVEQKISFMKQLGLINELKALEQELAKTDYKIPSPQAL